MPERLLERRELGTLPKLVEALEMADGRTPNALGSFAYVCRSEGLLSKSPGGRAASNVTLRDCANLTVASSVPVPLRLMPAAVRAFRALPRKGNTTTFSVGSGKRVLALPDRAGDFLELLIVSVPRLPDDIKVEFRFSPIRLALFAGIDRTVAVEYWQDVKIGLDPPGGDRFLEQRATFGIRTLRLVYDALQ